MVDATRVGLALTRFDAKGKAGPTEPLFDAKAKDAPRGVTEISEVAVASLGADLDVVWVERSAQGARARGLLRPLQARGNAPLQDLNAVDLPLAGPRGNLAIASSEAHFLVLSRRQKTACADSNQTDCVGFDLFRQELSGTARTGSPLAVPLPCEQNSVSFAVSGSRWYYGVCSKSTGKPLTTLFSIQSEPAYARADRILEGCLPLGATALDGDLIVIGDCSGQRQGLRVRGGNAALEEVRVDRLEVVCDAGTGQAADSPARRGRTQPGLERTSRSPGGVLVTRAQPAPFPRGLDRRGAARRHALEWPRYAEELPLRLDATPRNRALNAFRASSGLNRASSDPRS